jgi:hypothetical protein
LVNFRKNPTGGVSIEMAEPIGQITGKIDDGWSVKFLKYTKIAIYAPRALQR